MTDWKILILEIIKEYSKKKRTALMSRPLCLLHYNYNLYNPTIFFEV